MSKNIPKPKHDHASLKFPENFLWGAGTSAYQVEGGNTNTDWWEWEEKNQPPEKRSGEACDQYNRFDSDFSLAKELGHNSHRLSIEWSRIEPEEGKFSQEAIDHYKSVFKSLKEKNMTVMLTLYHFTLPLWISKKGGWENFKTPKYFNRFIKRIVPEFKEFVDFWITINEPGVYVFMSYQGGDKTGSWPPQKKSNFLSVVVMYNLARAHKKAYKTIHSLVPKAMVGIANNLNSFESFHKHSLIEQFAVIVDDFITNHSFYCLTSGFHDFFGVNYYFNWHLNRVEGKLLPEIVDVGTHGFDVTDMGWEIHPEGIFNVLTDISDHIPIFITECGIASTNDDRRNRFLVNYLQEVYRAIQAKVNIQGFFYWSLIDNFEWHQGFTPRFGLIEVDYATQKRTPRDSAYVYKEIIEENGIPHKMLRFLGHTVTTKEVLDSLHPS